MLQGTKSKGVFAVEETERSSKLQAEQAMRGDVMRGLIELITNSDDSYENMEKVGKKVSGLILIEVNRKERTIIVKDRAEGMTYDEMLEKLFKRGSKNEAFQSGTGRGNKGTGAKDIWGLGPFQFESVKNGHYSCFAVNEHREFDDEKTGYRKVIAEDKVRLGV